MIAYRRPGITLALLLLSSVPASSQEPGLPDVNRAVLRLEAGGPTSNVTALAFSPDGTTLYAAGFDKVVRVWKLDAAGREFVPQRLTFRVPIGPGLAGAINALAVSPDGRWLAVGGLMTYEGQAGFGVPGIVVPAATKSAAMLRDQGRIYVFDTAKPAETRALTGHLGPVLALAYVEQGAGQPPLLASAAREGAGADVNGAVRVWNVAEAKELTAPLKNLPDPDGRRVSLAAWRAGQELPQVLVAIGWDDGDFKEFRGRLRVWDVAGSRVLGADAAEGTFNNTACYLPDRKQLLTGSSVKTKAAGQTAYQGRLATWQVGAGPEVKLDKTAAVFPESADQFFLPRALAALSSRGDGQLDYAAVAVKTQKKSDPRAESYRLYLAPLQAPGTFRLADTEPLWGGVGSLPILAAAPRGRFLAVAGKADHSINVYPVPGLLGRRAQPQILRSVGDEPASVAFMRKADGRQGLLLSKYAKDRPGSPFQGPRKGDLIFDFTQRSLTSDFTGWRPDAPQLGGWAVSHQAAGKDTKNRPTGPSIQVRSPDGKARRIDLREDQAITDYALLPARPPFRVPLLAVSVLELGQPVLSLYRADTGVPFCQFTGHTGAIHCLAFTADGRLLVSAAEDQTVCVWSLVNLDKTLGKQGQLRGVAVTTGEKQVGNPVVSLVASDSPARGKVAPDEVVEGLLEKGELRRLDSPLAFYEALLRFAPGQKVNLRLKGPGGERSVALPVGQAVVERTPLLTFFLTAGGKADEREWIGWNPLGPHDSSTPEAARNLGWHINTGKAQAPTTFFPAGEKRFEKMRREGLLRYVVARGVLGPAVEDWDRDHPPAKPKVQLWIDAPDQNVVRQPRGVLRLRIDDFPADQVAEVSWQLNGGPPQPFRRIPRPEPSAFYDAEVSWKPGVNNITATVQTKEAALQPAPQERQVRFQPPPPVVLEIRQVVGHLLAGHAHPAARAALFPLQQLRGLSVAKEPFPVRAVVFPGLPDQKVEVRLFHRGLASGQIPLKGMGISHDVGKLEEGLNRIDIVSSADETPDAGRLTLEVAYTKPTPVPPPQILVDAVVPLTTGGEGKALAVIPGRPVIVDVPRVRIVGRIRAQKNLTTADWENPAGKINRLAGFDPTKKDLSFREEVTLRPGRQRVRFLAQAATSKSEEVTLTLDYHPRLPQVAGLRVSPPGPFVEEGQGPPKVRVEGQTQTLADSVKHSVNIHVFLDDAPVAELSPKDEKPWSAAFLLKPGKANRIRVVAKSAWREATLLDTPLDYKRPPRIVRWEGPDKSKEPQVNLAVRVVSPVPIKSAVADVNGRPVTGLAWAALPEKDAWTVRADQLALDPGENRITLHASNAEGVSREPGNWVVVYTPPPRRTPPVVELIEPAGTNTGDEIPLKLTVEDLRVRFRVRSEKPLKSVRLVLTRDKDGSDARTFDAAKGKPDAGGLVFETEPPLRLSSGASTLSVVAENPDGPGNVRAVLTVLLPPPRLVLTSLEPVGRPAGPPSPIAQGSDGRLTASKVAPSRLWLNGEVIWGSRKEKQLRDKHLVRVYVNGAQQLPEYLDPPEGESLKRTFKVQILLTKTKDNQVEVELPPGIRLDENNLASFSVDCDNPAAGQQLHVLVISPGRGDEEAIKSQVFLALQAKPAGGSEFLRPPFVKGILYGPMTGVVRPEELSYQLFNIKDRLGERAREGSPNDVVLLYFKGSETPTKSGQQLALSDGSQQLIAWKELEEFFESTPGVRVLLLDVRSKSVRPIRDVARWLQPPENSSSRYAWLRSTWTGKEEFPEDARLLTVLRQALDPQNRLDSLGKVAEYLDRQFISLAKKYQGQLGYNQSPLPPYYREVVISTGSGTR
jgi:WD40 repeat protein